MRCELSSDSEYSDREGIEYSESNIDLTEPKDKVDQAYSAIDASLLFIDNEYIAEYYI